MSKGESQPPILGIDLGTSTCEACVIRGDDKPLFVRPDLAYTGTKKVDPPRNEAMMPSVFCDRDGVPLVGFRAENELADPRYRGNVRAEIKNDMDRDITFEEKTPIILGGNRYWPSRITGHYVKVLVKAAEIELDLQPGTIKRAVVTVPANFTWNARRATKRACLGDYEIGNGGYGGLERVELVDEPIAAAYSRRLQDFKDKSRILVVDLGGGTLDLALLEVRKEIKPHGFREIARDGTSLGGLSWDREIARRALSNLRKENRISEETFHRLFESRDDYGHFRLFKACQRAKEDASARLKVRVGLKTSGPPEDLIDPLVVSFPPTDKEGEDNLRTEVPFKYFLLADKRLLIECDLVCNRLFGYARQTLKIADFGWKHLDHVYMAGGGSLLTTVQNWFTERLGGKPPIIDDWPQHAVCKGAAMLAERWRGNESIAGVIGATRYPRTIGFLTYPNGRDGEPGFCRVIPGGQRLPIAPTQEKFKVLNQPSRRRLEIEFAERDYSPSDLAGVLDLRDEARKEFTSPKRLSKVIIENLPHGTETGAREEGIVTVACGENQAPKFQIEFRGKIEYVDLNAEINRSEHARTNGTVHQV